MASFISSLASRDWSPTWFLGRLLRPPFLCQPSPACSSTGCNGFVKTDPSLLSSNFDKSSSRCPSGHGDVSISQREMVALGRIFDHFDENKDGKVSRDELRRSLHMFGIETDDEELKAIIDAADWNSDGFLDFSEFAAFYYSLNEEMGQKVDTNRSSMSNGEHSSLQKDGANGSCYDCDDANLSDAFKLFDINGDGYICAEELQSVLGSMGLSQGKLLSDCRNMIRSVDVDGDGQVSFAEFKQMMIAGFGQS